MLAGQFSFDGAKFCCWVEAEVKRLLMREAKDIARRGHTEKGGANEARKCDSSRRSYWAYNAVVVMYNDCGQVGNFNINLSIYK